MLRYAVRSTLVSLLIYRNGEKCVCHVRIHLFLVDVSSNDMFGKEVQLRCGQNSLPEQLPLWLHSYYVTLRSSDTRLRN